MKLLDKIKKEYVKLKYGFDYSHPFYEEKDLDEIAKRYAKAVLERAAGNAKVKVMDKTGFSYTTGCDIFKNITVEIDKQTILNTKID